MGTENCDVRLLIESMWWNIYCFNEISSNFLGHSRADDLLRCFPEVTFKLELDKTLQVSMEEPSVNLKFYKKLIKSQEISELHAVASTLLMGLPNLVPCHLSGILWRSWRDFIHHLMTSQPGDQIILTLLAAIYFQNRFVLQGG